MRIFIDASRALATNPTGIEIYCREIMSALLALPESANHTWRLLTNRQPPSDYRLAKLPAHATWQIIPGQRLWTLWHLSRYFRSQQSADDILFVPGHVLPLITPKKTVITIHDFAFRHFPEAYGAGERYWLNHELARSAKKASAILVPSRSTAADLIDFYGMNPGKIHVIAHGVDHQRYRSLTIAQRKTLPKPITGAEPYFLVIGRVEYRKNSHRIIEAYQQFRSLSKETTKLVFLGSPGYGWAEITAIHHHLPPAIQKDVLLLGYQSAEKTLTWLKAAQALVYPSLYEGFGMPILEAQAAGVPVLTSQTSSLNEVAGQAALIVDPTDTTALAQGLHQLTTSQPLRTELSLKGLSNAAHFTWQKAAEQTLAVLLTVARGEK